MLQTRNSSNLHEGKEELWFKKSQALAFVFPMFCVETSVLSKIREMLAFPFRSPNGLPTTGILKSFSIISTSSPPFFSPSLLVEAEKT
jgi:hypothetical protein